MTTAKTARWLGLIAYLLGRPGEIEIADAC